MARLSTMLCAFACASVFAQNERPSTGAIPLEQFTRHDEFGTIKISPDGRFLALSTGKYGRSAVAFFDLEKQEVVSGVRAGERMEIDEFDWVSPTRVVYQIAERVPGLTQPALTGEIFGIDRDGKRSTQLYGFRAGQRTIGTRLRKREASFASPELVSGLKGDDEHVLIAEFPWKLVGNYYRYDRDARPTIVRLDVYSGQKRELGVAPLIGASLLVDRNDQVRFASGLDREFRLAVSWKPEPDSEWTEFALPGFRDESIEPQRFSIDNHSVYFTGVREAERYAALYRLDLTTRAVEKVFGFEDCDVTRVISDFADEKIVGVAGYTHRPVYHWLNADDPAAKLYAALHRAFPGQDVWITSTTDDGHRAVVFVDSDVNPGEYYLFDTKAMKADYLRAARAWIDPRLMRPKTPIRFDARDGLTLHGYLTRPAGDGPHPLIVLPHGGPHFIRDRWAFDWEVQLLASRGYAVLQVNFRGSGGYGMDFEEAGYRQWGASMQDDLTDATRWAIEQKLAPADRICIFGASYGGYAALMGAAREPDLYRCAVGYAGVYDLELMHESADIPRSRRGRNYLARAVGTDAADLQLRSPVHKAESIRIPVLLVHGEADWRADYEQAKRMKAALERHDKAFEWMALSREGHGAYDDETRHEVYERILAFLAKHLNSDAATAATPASP